MLNYKKLKEQFQDILSEFDNERISNWIEFDEKRLKLEDSFNYGEIVLYNGIKVKYLGMSSDKALIRSAGYQRYVDINELNKI